MVRMVVTGSVESPGRKALKVKDYRREKTIVTMILTGSVDRISHREYLTRSFESEGLGMSEDDRDDVFHRKLRQSLSQRVLEEQLRE